MQELIIKINRCCLLYEVISLSRSWFWTASETEYKAGADLLIKKANQLNKFYSEVTQILVLR